MGNADEGETPPPRRTVECSVTTPARARRSVTSAAEVCERKLATVVHPKAHFHQEKERVMFYLKLISHSVPDSPTYTLTLSFFLSPPELICALSFVCRCLFDTSAVDWKRSDHGVVAGRKRVLPQQAQSKVADKVKGDGFVVEPVFVRDAPKQWTKGRSKDGVRVHDTAVEQPPYCQRG